jgi:23S rRNA pseudouridine1911/1915/1917 synthase
MGGTIETGRDGRHLTFFVEAEARGNRLDRYLSNTAPEYSRSFFQRLIRDGRVLVNGSGASGADPVIAGARIDVSIPEQALQTIGPEDIAVTVVYEDDWLAVVDKPAGLSVHPGAGRISGTLVSALLFRGMSLSPKAGEDRPGIVHRLDKDTSGLIVVAKDDRAYDGLKSQFMAHTVGRLYRGVCWGSIGQDHGSIDTLIARHGRDRTRMTTRTAAGRTAVTEYLVLERFRHMTYAQFRLKTGRTHQIRVHMASRGHPIVGDRTYGGVNAAKRLTERRLIDAVSAMNRQALHAASLGFVHPVSGKAMNFESTLPADITLLMEVLHEEKGRRDV